MPTRLKNLKSALSLDLILPLLLLITYIIFLLVLRGIFPTTDELINTFSKIYGRYGYEIIAIAAFLESLVLVNLFAPGGLALTLGVVFARNGELELPLVILFGALGAIGGYFVDYLLGRYGFSQILKQLGYEKLIDQAGGKIKKFGQKGLILGFIHANIAAYISVAAGTLNIGFKKFAIISIISTFFWSTLWALAVFAVGNIFLTILRKYGFLLILFSIIVIILMRLWEGEERGKRKG